MPDLNAVAVLDVVIGLIFVFFLLSIVCSGISELVSSWLRLRARNLEDGIRSLLGDPERTDEFFEHPRVRALMNPRKKRLPSYLPPRVFAMTVLDSVLPPAGEVTPAAHDDVVARATAAAATLPEGPLRVLLTDAVADARGDRDRLRAAIERSFDEVMNRASGWYKRRVQVILVVIAAVVVGLANADTFAIADRLWKDDALRAAVVQRAAEQTVPATSSAEPLCPTPSGQPADLEETADCIDDIEVLGIPLGWTADTVPEPDFFALLGKLLGLLITVAAVSLGAPFWFDLLGRVSQLRATGKPEPPSPGAPEATTVDQARSGSAPADREDQRD